MTIQDKIRGSLFGGAVGDALGYPVEFMGENAIFRDYGKNGIQEYDLAYNGKALISDDTQMTLFTASAVLFRAHRLEGRGIAAAPAVYANMTYQDWLVTQELTYHKAKKTVIKDYPDYPNGFISTIFSHFPELFNRRAPGITCLSALEIRRQQRSEGKVINRFITDKINNSKGCGGVMRTAPIGMMNWLGDAEAAAMQGAECAAITHCHSLGYMTGAVLAQMVYLIISDEKSRSLKEITLEARDTAAKLFAGDEHLGELLDCIDHAVALSENNASDLENIHCLGEGWVSEEALAIAIYCSLKYQNDFSRCMTVSVNHKGDSDSTGAIAGNILGAYTGYEAMEQKWKENLELSEMILKVADMLSDCYCG